MVRRLPRILLICCACVLLPPAVAGLDGGAPSSIPAIRGLPGYVAEDITAYPEPFYWAMREVLAEPPELLRLVDRSNGLGEGYEPDNLVDLSEKHEHIRTVGRQRVTERAAEALSRMVRSAREDGVELTVSSAYRSFERQVALHDYWKDELGETLARAVSAPPGYSQHQLGTTVDFAPVGRAFEDTPSDMWLRENAWRYGFSLSYPEGYEEITGYNYESWHYRYIGTAATYAEQRFFDGVQQYLLEYLHEHRTEIEQWATSRYGDPTAEP